MLDSRKTPFYGNCIIVAPDGKALCRASHRKIDWYLKKDLGTIVSSDPLTLKLKFEPNVRKGMIHSYSLSHKDNICVCCGSSEDITRHHVVPYCFRKHFPEELKRHAIHDVLILCVKCHEFYEKSARIKKQELADEYSISLQGTCVKIDEQIRLIRSAGNALKKHIHKIPEERRNALLSILENFYQKEITPTEIEEASNMRFWTIDPQWEPFGKKVVTLTDNLDNFIKDWRTHFVNYMKPKYLPLYWKIDNDIDL